MKKSSVRVGLAIVVILIAGGVAGLELKDSLATDESADVRIRNLESFWPSRRRAAAMALGSFSAEADKVVPSLTKALGDSDADVRLHAVNSLVSYGEKSKPAAAVLTAMVKRDPDSRIRPRAAALLGAIKETDTVAALIGVLDDPDPAVQLEAIRSLGRFDPSIASGPVVDKLIAALGPGGTAERRHAAVGALDSLARDQERAGRAIAEVAASDPSDLVRREAVGLIKKVKFGFELPILIAALEDPSPPVRLMASSNLAWIGLVDDRIVPALCKSALQADQLTREGIGININLLMLDRVSDKMPADQVTAMYLNAVRSFRTVIETRSAAAREQVVGVLGRLIATYARTKKPALLEPARAAAMAVLARIEDEQEEVPIRLVAMDQWTVINLNGRGMSPRPDKPPMIAAAPKDDFRPKAMWIEALGRQLASPCAEARFRAGEILVANFKDRDSDPSFRDAWRKSVPSLAKATQTDDVKVRGGILTLLTELGPEAVAALPTLRSLAHDSKDDAVRSAAEIAIKSISSVDHLKAPDPAVRSAAALALGRLGWPAATAVPALASVLKDPEIKVRLAAATALQALGPVSKAAVPSLAMALASDTDPDVRVAIVEAFEAIDPGAPPVVDAHLLALRDPSAKVRKAGAIFHLVPADDSLVSSLEKALGDPDEAVRLEVGNSLTRVLFENPTVVPTLLKGLEDHTQRKAVIEAVGAYLENVSDTAAFSRLRGNLRVLEATLVSVIPLLTKALSATDQETRALVYGLLGRIIAFSELTRDERLRKAIEPVVQAYVKGLEENDPTVRQEVVEHLESISIGKGDIVAALKKLLERSDLPADERQTAVALLEVKSTPAGAAAPKKKGRATGPGAGLFRIRD